MKKILILLAVITLSSSLAACSGSGTTEDLTVQESTQPSENVTDPEMPDPPKVILRGEENVSIQLGDPYEEQGAYASYDDDTFVAIPQGNVDIFTVGTYYINYIANVNGTEYTSVRIVNVVEPKLTEDELLILKGSLVVKSQLKNPSSIVISAASKIYPDDTGDYVYLRVGGENSFGAVVFSDYTVTDGIGFGLDYYASYDIELTELLFDVPDLLFDDFNFARINYYLSKGELPE